jgi:hypothetical protein
VTLKPWTWIVAVALAVSVAACGSDGQADDDDDSGGPDAGVPGDGADTDPTSDVAGAWHFTAEPLGNDSATTCTVMIGGGVFDVTCPQGEVPRPAGEGCQQLRDDLHIHGNIIAALVGHLDGMLDTIVEYEGSSCVTYGLTVGAPFPLPAFAQLTADRTEKTALGDFLAHLGGRWAFTLDDTREEGQSCDVDISLALARRAAAVQVDIACPQEDPTEVVPDCTAQPFITLSLTAQPGALDGTLADTIHHTGAGCTPDHPPTISIPRYTLAARPINP